MSQDDNPLYLLPHKAGVARFHREVEVCDFCLKPGAAGHYQIPPNKIDLGFVVVDGRKAQVFDRDGQWNACGPCRDLIEGDDWEGVARRVWSENAHQPEVVGSLARLRKFYGKWRLQPRTWVGSLEN